MGRVKAENPSKWLSGSQRALLREVQRYEIRVLRRFVMTAAPRAPAPIGMRTVPRKGAERWRSYPDWPARHRGTRPGWDSRSRASHRGRGGTTVEAGDGTTSAATDETTREEGINRSDEAANQPSPEGVPEPRKDAREEDHDGKNRKNPRRRPVVMAGQDRCGSHEHSGGYREENRCDDEIRNDEEVAQERGDDEVPARPRGLGSDAAVLADPGASRGMVEGVNGGSGLQTVHPDPLRPPRVMRVAHCALDTS